MELCCIKNINITKVNGKKVSNKDWVFQQLKMAVFIMANGKMIQLKEMVYFLQ